MCVDINLSVLKCLDDCFDVGLSSEQVTNGNYFLLIGMLRVN